MHEVEIATEENLQTSSKNAIVCEEQQVEQVKNEGNVRKHEGVCVQEEKNTITEEEREEDEEIEALIVEEAIVEADMSKKPSMTFDVTVKLDGDDASVTGEVDTLKRSSVTVARLKDGERRKLWNELPKNQVIQAFVCDTVNDTKIQLKRKFKANDIALNTNLARGLTIGAQSFVMQTKLNLATIGREEHHGGTKNHIYKDIQVPSPFITLKGEDLSDDVEAYSRKRHGSEKKPRWSSQQGVQSNSEATGADPSTTVLGHEELDQSAPGEDVHTNEDCETSTTSNVDRCKVVRAIVEKSPNVDVMMIKYFKQLLAFTVVVILMMFIGFANMTWSVDDIAFEGVAPIGTVHYTRVFHTLPELQRDSTENTVIFNEALCIKQTNTYDHGVTVRVRPDGAQHVLKANLTVSDGEIHTPINGHDGVSRSIVCTLSCVEIGQMKLIHRYEQVVLRVCKSCVPSLHNACEVISVVNGRIKTEAGRKDPSPLNALSCLSSWARNKTKENETIERVEGFESVQSVPPKPPEVSVSAGLISQSVADPQMFQVTSRPDGKDTAQYEQARRSRWFEEKSSVNVCVATRVGREWPPGRMCDNGVRRRPEQGRINTTESSQSQSWMRHLA